MKRLLLISLLALTVATGALAQQDVGTIGIFSDPAGTNCFYDDSGFAIFKLYIFHQFSNDGASAAQFKVRDSGSTLAFTGGSSPFPLAIGSPFTDLSISYIACVTGTFLVYELNFVGQGTSPNCTEMEIVPSDGQTEVLVAHCPTPIAFVGAPNGGLLVVNTDGNCGCRPTDNEERNTWGKVKSLYR